MAEGLIGPPGGQRCIRKNRAITLAWCLAAVATVVLVCSFASDADSRDNAFTLFTATVGLAIALQQWAASVRPYLSHTAAPRQNEHGSALYVATPPSSPHPLSWKVALRNVGGGPAIFRKVHFELCLPATAAEAKRAAASYDSADALAEALGAAGLSFGTDFYLYNVSPGGALAPLAETALFELAICKSHAISTLDIHLEFEGLLGDRFTKTVNCIPRAGELRRLSARLCP
ncbi:MAG: hypothetical protein IPG64_06070 [Haliea sp.]|nr:hypothetical protein [Gammaproteobacteria bacterium]MBK6737506.1 hypothetical protein [Haliea sp.]MBK9470023.1 hypothetical protein [Gammaproteobacteria bacterium]